MPSISASNDNFMNNSNIMNTPAIASVSPLEVNNTPSPKSSAESFFNPSIITPKEENKINIEDLPNPPYEKIFTPEQEAAMKEQERLEEEKRQREEEERKRIEQEKIEKENEIRIIEEGASAALGPCSIDVLCNIKWKIKDLSKYFVAVSKYGGPIAILAKDQKFGCRIEVYGTNGETMWSRSCPTTSKIISIGWIDSEMLVVIPENGKMFIYTLSAEEVSKPILPENCNDLIEYACITGKGVAVFTNNKGLYCIENIEINSRPVVYPPVPVSPSYNYIIYLVMD